MFDRVYIYIKRFTYQPRMFNSKAQCLGLVDHSKLPKYTYRALVIVSGSTMYRVFGIAYCVLRIAYCVKDNIVSVIFNDTVQYYISRGLAETMIMAHPTTHHERPSSAHQTESAQRVSLWLGDVNLAYRCFIWLICEEIIHE